MDTLENIHSVLSTVVSVNLLSMVLNILPDYLDVTDTASISTKADIFTSESLSSSSCKNPTTGLAVNIMKRNIQ